MASIANDDYENFFMIAIKIREGSNSEALKFLFKEEQTKYTSKLLLYYLVYYVSDVCMCICTLYSIYRKIEYTIKKLLF